MRYSKAELWKHPLNVASVRVGDCLHLSVTNQLIQRVVWRVPVRRGLHTQVWHQVVDHCRRKHADEES